MSSSKVSLWILRVHLSVSIYCLIYLPMKIQKQTCMTEKVIYAGLRRCMLCDVCDGMHAYYRTKETVHSGISGLDGVVCFEIHGNARSPIRLDKYPPPNVSNVQFLRRSAIDFMECWTLTITNTKNVKLVWALLWRLVSLTLLLLPFWCDLFTKWSLHLKEGHGLGCSVCPLNKY